MRVAVIATLLLLTEASSYAGSFYTECEPPLKTGAYFNDVKRQLEAFLKTDHIEIGKSFRIVTANGYELSFQFGNFNEGVALNSSIGLAPYRYRETFQTARAENTSIEVFLVHRIWFSNDFKELHLNLDQHNFRHLTLFLLDAFDGKNLVGKNIAKIDLQLDPEDKVHRFGAPFVTRTFQSFSVTYDNTEAAEIRELLTAVEPYIRQQSENAKDDFLLLLTGNGLKGGSFFYRGALEVHSSVVEFEPLNQLEVHYVLSGLRALGLRSDHPIFQYADNGYFR